MGGIAEVARVAGVSKSTASRALTGNGYVSPATRERVARVAEDLGYVASSSASSLATGRTRNIGVVMPYLNRWFFAEVLEGVQEVLLAEGFDLTLYDAKPGTEGRRRVFDDFLARKRFDGLIAVALEPDDHELERLVGIGRPVGPAWPHSPTVPGARPRPRSRKGRPPGTYSRCAPGRADHRP